ncbi:MAG: hypothetical protein KIT10_03080 [Flavobacteriales bacterium]|nr:hypothetical protein [Flavobacteriales bacterium]
MPIGTKRPLLISLALLHGVASVAQTDSTATEAIEEAPVIITGGVPEAVGHVSTNQQDTLDWRQRHSAHKASLYSAVLPGAGQIYNRKYWKAPIVWAGLGTCVWFINDNTGQYKYYRREYLAMVDNDPDTVSEFEGEFAPEAVRDVMDTYRRWRDLSYIAFGLVYMLNIVDASVDAHFVRFDVGPHLSLRLGPSMPVAAQGGMGIGMALTLR